MDGFEGVVGEFRVNSGTDRTDWAKDGDED